MKKLLFLPLLFVIALVNAQTPKENLEHHNEWLLNKAGNAADVIFEGMITGIKSFRYADNSIYTACITEVNMVYKGNIKPGTGNIIVEGGAIGGVVIQRYHQIYAKHNEKSVFFCEIFDNRVFPTVWSLPIPMN